MRLLTIWGILVAATLTSFLIGEDAKPGTVATVAIITIAFVKVRLVVQEFMEVRLAPRLLGFVTDAWIVGIWGLLIALPSLVSRNT